MLRSGKAHALHCYPSHSPETREGAASIIVRNSIIAAATAAAAAVFPDLGPARLGMQAARHAPAAITAAGAAAATTAATTAASPVGLGFFTALHGWCSLLVDADWTLIPAWQAGGSHNHRLIGMTVELMFRKHNR